MILETTAFIDMDWGVEKALNEDFDKLDITYSKVTHVSDDPSEHIISYDVKVGSGQSPDIIKLLNKHELITPQESAKLMLSDISIFCLGGVE